MTLFLQEPEYVFGCLGFVSSKEMRRVIVWVGAGVTALAVTSAPMLLLWHHTTPSRVVQTIIQVLAAWIYVFGVSRVFWTGYMWFWNQVGVWVIKALPRLATEVHQTYLSLWMCFEIFCSLGFLAFLVDTILLPFGIVQPLLYN